MAIVNSFVLWHNFPWTKVKRNENRLKGKHFSIGTNKKGRCIVCGRKKKPDGKRKDTKTRNYCPKCKVYACRVV